MLRRSAKSAFMPDALVFPGGRVEREDAEHAGAQLAEDALPPDAAFARAAQRECIEEASLRVELDALRWFDTWKTPSGESPRRFHARFFLAEIGADEGHDAVADGEETHAGRWATAAAILDQWRAEAVDLPPPTLSILLGIAADDWRGWLTRSADEARAPILPKVTAVESTIQIVMPHDPAYAELPGDSAPAPARAHAFPRRFTRVGKRWMPES